MHAWLRAALLGAAGAAPVQELEIRSGEPVELALEPGASLAAVRLAVPRRATVVVWADSDELMPRVRVERADGRELGSLAVPPTGPTPYLTVLAEEGDELWILVSSEPPGTAGTLLLRANVLDRTRAAAEALERTRAGLGEASDLAARGEHQVARGVVLEVRDALAALREDGSLALYDAHQLLATAGHRFGLEAMTTESFRQSLRRIEWSLPSRSRPVIETRSDLATSIMAENADMREARELFEQALRDGEAAFGPRSPELQNAREMYSWTHYRLGNYAASRDLIRDVIAVYESAPVPDLFRLNAARTQLSSSLEAMDRLDEARELAELACAELERVAPAGSTHVENAWHALAVVCARQSDFEPARELLERVLALREERLPPDHFDVVMVRGNLATLERESGHPERALPLHERTVEIYRERFPVGDYHRLLSLRNLSWTHAVLGDAEGARRVARELAEGLCVRLLESAHTAAPRELEAQALAWKREFAIVLSIANGAEAFPADPELEAECFRMIETLRGASLLAAGLLRLARDTEGLEEALARVREATRQVVLAAGSGTGRLGEEVRVRDRRQRELLALLSRSGETRGLTRTPDRATLAADLAPDEALVTYWQYERYVVDETQLDRDEGTESLCAFVLRADGTLRRFELGAVAPIRNAVEAWRAELLAGGGGLPRAERGVVLASAADPRPAPEAGARLRSLVLDPLLSALEGAARLTVSPDDALHLAPLDALPLDGEGLLGDSREVHVRSSSWEALLPAAGGGAEGLVVLGGVDYGDVAGAERPLPHVLEPLPGTLRESESVAALYRERFGDEDALVSLAGAAATKAALDAAAGGSRWVHLATHGWFQAQAEGPTTSMWMGTPGTPALSPLVLCGLALAGANEDDAGLLTAEELAAFDFSDCELAVLSACDTNLGLSRPGQGLASLQKALHLAGARSVVSSLWRVSDQATSELMTELYRRLWIEGEPKHRALWGAKNHLRHAVDAEGRPRFAPRDWAGWVLTGDPD